MILVSVLPASAALLRSKKSCGIVRTAAGLDCAVPHVVLLPLPAGRVERCCDNRRAHPILGKGSLGHLGPPYHWPPPHHCRLVHGHQL
jgi:hypothetical protein